MAGIGGFIFCVHLEYICVDIIAKLLGITSNITEDISVRHYGCLYVLVKNGNINEHTSGSNNWHASSLHKRDLTPEISKRFMKN